MHRLNILSALAVLLSTAVFAPAQSTQPDAPTTRATLADVEHLKKQLHGIDSVECDFVETKKLAMLDHTLIIRGHCALAKPARLLWVVDSPLRYAVRIEGDEVKQWDEDSNKVETIHLGGDATFKAISQQIQAWFLGNYSLLAGDYDLYLTARQPLSLAFIPRPGSAVLKLIQRIDLTFNAPVTYLDTIAIRESGGDLTSIHFIDPVINHAVDSATWEMPPHER